MQTQTTQRVCTLLLRERHPNDFVGACHPQCDGICIRHGQDLVIHWADLRLWCATNVQHQLGDALDVFYRQLRINTAFKAVTRIGRKVVATRTACDGGGPPESGFDVDVFRLVRYGCGIATHDAREGLDLTFVSDHADLAVYGHGMAIEQLQLFAITTPAHLQTTVDLVKVKNM